MRSLGSSHGRVCTMGQFSSRTLPSHCRIRGTHRMGPEMLSKSCGPRKYSGGAVAWVEAAPCPALTGGGLERLLVKLLDRRRSLTRQPTSRQVIDTATPILMMRVCARLALTEIRRLWRHGSVGTGICMLHTSAHQLHLRAASLVRWSSRARSVWK